MRRLVVALLLGVLAGCGGGSGGDGGPTVAAPPPPVPASAPDALSVAEVQRILSQAVQEAQARGAAGTIAVVDRSGNVLAVFRMTGAAATFTISERARRDGRPREREHRALRVRRDQQGDHRRLPLLRRQRFHDAHREPDRAGELQPGRNRLAGRAALRRAVLPALVLRRRRRDAGAPWGPSPRRSASPPIPAACRSTRTASWWAASGSSRTRCTASTSIITDIDQDLDELIAVAGTRGFDAPAACARTASPPTAGRSASSTRRRSCRTLARRRPRRRRARARSSPFPPTNRRRR